MNWRKLFAIASLHLMSFTAGIYIGSVIQVHKTNNTMDEAPIIQCDGTNSLKRVNKPQAPGWFKETSKYVWDGWKIK